MRALAVIISYLLHPVFCLTWLMGWFLVSANYFSYFMSPSQKILLFSAVLIFSVILPLLNFALLKKLGYISHLHLKRSSERFMPYVSSLVLHAGLLYILIDLDIPFFFKYLVITSIAVLIMLLAFNYFIKISAHLASAGCCFAVICFYEAISFTPSLSTVCVCAGFCGLTAFSRLYLQAHDQKQVYLGFASGFFTGLLCLFLLIQFNFKF